jgi:hypothetical protein
VTVTVTVTVTVLNNEMNLSLVCGFEGMDTDVAPASPPSSSDGKNRKFS